MATTTEVVRSLTSAAEGVLGRKVTPPEQHQLLNFFVHATGTDTERALKAIRQFCNLTDDQLQVKLGSSDDTNRKMEDLKRTLEAWIRST